MVVVIIVTDEQSSVIADLRSPCLLKRVATFAFDLDDSRQDKITLSFLSTLKT